MKSGKLYDESVDMQVVIKSAMDKAAAQAERSLCFVKAEAFASDFAMERRGTELDTDDLSDMTVKHLRDHFGQFSVLCGGPFCDSALKSDRTSSPDIP